MKTQQATQTIVGPQGQRMTRTATEVAEPDGLRMRIVEDVIDLDWIREEYKRRVPLWRRLVMYLQARR
jgi:hypothetical protein